MTQHGESTEPGSGMRDVTENHELELARLREMVVHLSRVSAMGTTAAMIAHEVSQPLTAANHYLGAARRHLLAQDAAFAAQALESVDFARECLARTTDILKNVREAAASKAFNPVPLDLHSLLAKVIQLHGAAWGMVPAIDIPATIGKVVGDPVQIGQVLANLIKNAVEATEGQPSRLVAVSAQPDTQNTVLVRVEDNGPGIAPDLQGQLFTPFSSTKPEGIGVGLSICRTIIEHHQGRIWAEPMSGGTAFCFTLMKPEEGR